MNLLNLVDANVPVVSKELADPPGWKEASQDFIHVKWALKFVGDRRYSEVPWWKEVLAAQDNRVATFLFEAILGGEQLRDHGVFPERGSQINLLSRTPQANLGSILDIALALGFICVPVTYVDLEAITQRGSERSAVERFARLDFSNLDVDAQKTRKNSGLDVFVLGPATIYNLDKHLTARDSNREVFAGKNEQAFLALRLALPTLRAMRVQIDTLSQNVKTLWDSQREHRHAIEQLQASQEMLKAEQIRQVRAAAEHTLREAARAHTESWASFRAPGDPLMFAIKHGTSVRDRTAPAFIGPCWGPDFDDIVAAAVGLVSSAENRKKVGELLQIWW